jgi:DNA-binding beta-propeller fold protein YncE
VTQNDWGAACYRLGSYRSRGWEKFMRRAASALAIFILVLAFATLGQTNKPAPQKTPQYGHWGPSGYHLVKTIPIPGNNSFGGLEFDAARRRLFVAHGVHVVVLNPDTGKIVGDIPNTLGAHSIVLAPDLNRGFVSDGQTNDVTIFNLTTLKVIGVAPTADEPYTITYDPVTKRVFTMNHSSSTATAIDATTGRPIGDIPLDGQPVGAVADGKGHLYINLESTSEELEIDSKSFAFLNRWPMSPCDAPNGLSMDLKRRLLFAGCRNDRMGILNADTGEVLAAPAAGSRAGVGRFDPVTQYAFSANEDGTLTIVIEAPNDRFNVVENVATEPGAHTMALDPTLHEVFLVTAQFLPVPPSSPPHTQPQMVQGTVHVLVFGRDYNYR